MLNTRLMSKLSITLLAVIFSHSSQNFACSVSRRITSSSQGLSSFRPAGRRVWWPRTANRIVLFASVHGNWVEQYPVTNKLSEMTIGSLCEVLINSDSNVNQ